MLLSENPLHLLKGGMLFAVKVAGSLHLLPIFAVVWYWLLDGRLVGQEYFLC